jgi:hypothetical protein
MKKIALLCFLFLALNYFSKDSTKVKVPYPRNIIDVGIGAGTNHGLIGAQTVIGYKGSGLLLGAGLYGGVVGLQASYKWIFASVSYGAYNIVNDNGSVYSLYGGIFLLGGKINLSRSKRWYLQLAGGYAGGGYVSTPVGDAPINTVTFDLGLGYRIPFKRWEKKNK